MTIPAKDKDSGKREVGQTDIIGGVALGGEYFLSDHFSFGVEAQANVTRSDNQSFRFGNPGGLTLNTATAVLATVYF